MSLDKILIVNGSELLAVMLDEVGADNLVGSEACLGISKVVGSGTWVELWVGDVVSWVYVWVGILVGAVVVFESQGVNGVLVGIVAEVPFEI